MSMKPTPRELQILSRIARGDSTGEVAESLGCAQSTVKTHLDRVRGRMGAKTTAHAMAMCYEQGWLGERPVISEMDVKLRGELWQLHVDLSNFLSRVMGIGDFMGDRKDSVIFYKDDAGEWRWSRTNAYNGKIVSEGGEGYHNLGDCVHSAQKQFGDTVNYYDNENAAEITYEPS